MGIFSNLFKKTKNQNNSFPTEYKSILEFNNEFKILLSQDQYIARSDYAYLIDKYHNTFLFYDNNRKANTLVYYCKNNKLNIEEINSFLQCYSDIVDLRKGSIKVKQHNEEFLSAHLNTEKQYLDGILNKVDPKIKLDDEQRLVILSDEDYSLVIAGAGAGKTTTVAAKVRYLVEKKQIDPKQILVISFTNKAVG